MDLDAPPSIEISSDRADGSTACIGQQVNIDFKMFAPATIMQFKIIKNGTTTLVERSDAPFNEFTFSTTYQFDNDDLDAGTVTLSVEVTDLENRMSSDQITFNVVAEFEYTNSGVVPRPSFDLANNVVVTTEMGDSVDIFFRRESESCGSFCTYFRYTLVSRNDTRFYNIPLQPDVTFVNNRFKQADVEALLTGLNAETEIVVFSSYPEDFTATGSLNKFPIVAEIRGTGEYAVLDADLSSTGNPRLRYRKRTELAGN
jgi:hypothetical protein